ncbi:MAG: hypothetical protein EXR81_04925 [Gammaproteobacteria bacterium]|nr:hypothetical protein [Gammaproteobacteria bacterium]
MPFFTGFFDRQPRNLNAAFAADFVCQHLMMLPTIKHFRSLPKYHSYGNPRPIPALQMDVEKHFPGLTKNTQLFENKQVEAAEVFSELKRCLAIEDSNQAVTDLQRTPHQPLNFLMWITKLRMFYYQMVYH